MNTFGRSLIRQLSRTSGLQNVCNNIGSTPAPAVRAFTRSYLVMSSQIKGSLNQLPTMGPCGCGCGLHDMHTSGDRDLVDFLKKEISVENQNKQSIPTHINDFKIERDGADITLTKTFHDEKISVSVNVNHSVDSDSNVEADADAEETGSLQSRPNFEVDIKVGNRTMSYTCSFLDPTDMQPNEEGQTDNFGISELTIFEGEFAESTYASSADIMDSNMYELLMCTLDERGISTEFADKLSLLSTNYEHDQFVTMLEKMQKFLQRS